MNNTNLFCNNIRLSSRYNYVLFPFTTTDLLRTLSAASDYTLAPPPRSQQVPVGTTLDWGGQVARKHDITIDFDSYPQILGAEGTDPNEVVRIFNEVFNLIKSQLSVEFEENARFFEFVASYTLIPSESPLKILAKIKPAENVYKNISAALGNEVSTYSIHVCSPNDTVNTANWFDLRIRPYGPQSKTDLEINFVYRSEKKEKTIAHLSNLENMLSKTLSSLNLQ